VIGVYTSKSLKPAIDAGCMRSYEIIRKLRLAAEYRRKLNLCGWPAGTD
jgi:hypothetical protein